MSPLKLGIVSSQQLIIRLSFATKLFLYLVAKVFVCSHVLKAGTMDDPSLAAAVVTCLLVYSFFAMLIVFAKVGILVSTMRTAMFCGLYRVL